MTRISRRGALKTLGTAAAAGTVLGLRDPASAAAATQAAGVITAEMLMPIVDVVLPSELGSDGRHEAAVAFVRWVRNYKEGVDTDHGYGNTRIRSTGPSPARSYPAQLAALEDAARAKGATSFAAAPLDVRRAIVEAALAGAKVERLASRPNGAHIASDVMSHYFNSAAGEDFCYGAAIGRDSCRGLPGSETRPEPLKR